MLFIFAHEAAGASCARHSLRPLNFRRLHLYLPQNSRASRGETAEVCANRGRDRGGWVFSPRPACGERSKPQASGEGDHRRVRMRGDSPSPPTLSPQAGRGRSRARRECRGVYQRRPCVRRDPYAVTMRIESGARFGVVSNNASRWLWVPAFAGTTSGRVMRREIAEVWVNCASCHCEEPTRRSNPAFFFDAAMDCFAYARNDGLQRACVWLLEMVVSDRCRVARMSRAISGASARDRSRISRCSCGLRESQAGLFLIPPTCGEG